MSIAQQPPITAEEFAAMTQDDAWKEELRDGRVHRIPLASARHGMACAHLAQALGNYCHTAGWGVVSIGCGLVVAREPDNVFAPDLACWSANRPPDVTNGWPSVPPLLIAEVIESVSEFHDTMGKMPYYFSFGIDLIWLVGLQRRVVEIHRLANHPQPFDPWEWRYVGYQRAMHVSGDHLLDGGDVLPGFSCKVSDLFA